MFDSLKFTPYFLIQIFSKAQQWYWFEILQRLTPYWVIHNIYHYFIVIFIAIEQVLNYLLNK
ncbi:MAG: hypothetical protein ACI8SR_000017 [Oceanicoccus sp.]|jgi:hypothetical protein